MRSINIVIIVVGMAAILALLASCSPTVKYLCPPLAPPPLSTLDALESQGRKDPNTASWVVDLDKHYKKLDACR